MIKEWLKIKYTITKKQAFLTYIKLEKNTDIIILTY